MSLPDVDLAVVGAGAAGIAAARAAMAQGRSVRVLEARSRVGGRAWTDTGLGIPFDAGAAWLHRFGQNPLRELAESCGLSCSALELAERTHLGDRWAEPEEERERREFFAQAYQTAWSAAADGGRDVSVRELLPAGRWAMAFEQWLADDDGSDPSDISSLDFARYLETDEHGIVAGGIGSLLERLASGLEVARSCPVTRVDWDGAGVALGTPLGTVRCRQAIVTLPTGVLADGAIEFRPALPDESELALRDLPLGNRDKVALVFDRDVFGFSRPTFVHAEAKAPDGLGFELPAYGRPVAVGHLGGRLADRLEGAGERAMIDFALAELVRIFGSALEGRLVDARSTAWRSDPCARGAYSHARPGRAAARQTLARPLAGKLFFAGEACSVAAYGTLHGAWQSGVSAAEAALSESRGAPSMLAS